MRGNPVCIKCETEESPIWTNAENLGAVCLNCLKDLGIKKEENEEADKDTEKDEAAVVTMRRTRSMRTGTATVTNPPTGPAPSTQTKSKPGPKASGPKGKNRRLIFKKAPTKAPTSVATPVTSDSVFYKGLYFQKGDIVSLIDDDDNIYYAQLRGFLTDQYCEKSAVITWLLPTRESPPPFECFDPATYVTGPEEELPRKLDCMEFVMHAPSDYYKSRTTPYPPVYPTPEPGYIWSRLEPINRLLVDDKDDDVNNDCDQ